MDDIGRKDRILLPKVEDADDLGALIWRALEEKLKRADDILGKSWRKNILLGTKLLEKETWRFFNQMYLLQCQCVQNSTVCFVFIEKRAPRCFLLCKGYLFEGTVHFLRGTNATTRGVQSIASVASVKHQAATAGTLQKIR